MPVFNYTCELCGPVRRFFSAPPSEDVTCLKCGQDLTRVPQPPSANVVERLDGPFMARAIERPADAERLYKERSKIDPLKEK